jgi:hypothetical protein
VICRGVFEEPVVCAGDEPRTDESNANRHAQSVSCVIGPPRPRPRSWEDRDQS